MKWVNSTSWTEKCHLKILIKSPISGLRISTETFFCFRKFKITVPKISCLGNRFCGGSHGNNVQKLNQKLVSDNF